MSWQWSWRQPATAQSACSWRMQLCRTGWLHLKAICRMHSVRCSIPLPPITQPCSVQRGFTCTILWGTELIIEAQGAAIEVHMVTNTQLVMPLSAKPAGEAFH